MLRKIDYNGLGKRILVTFLYPIMAGYILLTVLPSWEIREHWDILLFYSVLTLVCAFAPVSTLKATLTLSGAVIFSGILMYGTWAGIWSAFLETLIISFLFKSPLPRILANAGQLILTAWITGLAKNLLDTISLPNITRRSFFNPYFLVF
ncbi:hypothetical protein [Brevibacillus sp. SYP-B805]|uniref:hypothetical protein n=1 Tax=Brevibacillus sp. SYP-B805 TaxID=1578199 RepID=UPI001F494C6C|nr:hypothetical protein [Brevibacillus sp. SYP-B805]